MSQIIAPDLAVFTPAPRLRGLLSSEVLRARSRRSLRWMLLAGVLAVLGVAAILFVNTGPVDQADLDQAAANYLAEQEACYEQCLADPMIPEDQKAGACWKPTEQDAVQGALWNLPKQPFLASDMEGLLFFGGGIGVLIALMMAASAGGADWGARTMGLLLSWEPRRIRVLLVRLGVVAVLGLGVVAILTGMALGLGHLLSQIHGPVGEVPGLTISDGALSDTGEAFELALRWLPLGVLAAAGGLGLAMATRSTGWAIGAAIGFVTIVESVVSTVWPWSRQWLVQTNVAAWLGDGMTVTVDPAEAQAGAGFAGGSVDYVEPGTIWLSDTRALLTLGAMCLALLLVAGLLLRSRDVD